MIRTAGVVLLLSFFAVSCASSPQGGKGADSSSDAQVVPGDHAPHVSHEPQEDQVEPNRPIDSEAYYHYVRALMYQNQGKLYETAKEFKKVLKYDPAALDVYAALTSLYLQLGEIEKATKVCKKGLNIDPNHSRLLLNWE